MDVDEKYFSNITKRERAIFEGAISMGAYSTNLWELPSINSQKVV